MQYGQPVLPMAVLAVGAFIVAHQPEWFLHSVRQSQRSFWRTDESAYIPVSEKWVRIVFGTVGCLLTVGAIVFALI
jgi:hypothetical protein